MPNYTAQQGDCISSIAYRHGLLGEKIWNHPRNTQLKERRKDPNVLHPGDVVFIPEKEGREESGSTEQRHRFRKKGVPARLRFRIMEEPSPDQESSSGPSEDGTESQRRSPGDRPRANVPYILDIDGSLTEGQTGDDGMIDCAIPPDAQRGRLILEPGTANEMTLPLQLGHLDPLGTVSGMKSRLANLGFDCGDRNETETPALRQALHDFQEKYSLEPSGEIDEATRNKLEELHGR